MYEQLLSRADTYNRTAVYLKIEKTWYIDYSPFPSKDSTMKQARPKLNEWIIQYLERGETGID